MQFTDGCVTALQRQLGEIGEGRGGSKGSIVFSTREMEFSLLYDGSFVVSWDINEKDRYRVDETSGIY